MTRDYSRLLERKAKAKETIQTVIFFTVPLAILFLTGITT